MFAGKKSAQIREILISESAWEEMTCLFAPSLDEQIQLASWIRDQCDKLDMLNTKAKCTIDLMQERRIALISAAVTGKIDLRGWTPPSDNEVTA
ncbi:hypothetical protein JC965_21410 [Aeromonas caviae]|uniref:Type I restriction modification DNA specificity domain-containing protein n=1 Tax=Aeromonas caviae TaxID=648 RepID=A0A7T4C2S6_AERCA|nr:hypothetical protein [Aeromonas caviae]QQA60585.1 hypothetical protein JC965_21410 [Aeromonas caviae]